MQMPPVRNGVPFSVVGGSTSALLALGGIIDVFVPFLLLLAALIPPIAAIYVVHFYAFGQQSYNIQALDSGPPVRYNAFLAWIIGSAMGVATTWEYVILTTVPAIDAALISGAGYWLLKRALFAQRLGIGAVERID